MGYEEVWRVLADLLTELKERSEAVPADVMNDLRSAKTMIQILRADPTHTENLPRIETYLENVEFRLISAAQERFGSEYVERWMKRLEQARRKTYDLEKAAPRFVPGIPKGKHWVRVQVSEETPRKDIERLAKENRLTHRAQEDGYVLVYGTNENVRSFVKELAEKFRGERKL
ncbi:MAG: DUF2096 family protein [Candidatus Bathyarchaeia archaeon]